MRPPHTNSSFSISFIGNRDFHKDLKDGFKRLFIEVRIVKHNESNSLLDSSLCLVCDQSLDKLSIQNTFAIRLDGILRTDIIDGLNVAVIPFTQKSCEELFVNAESVKSQMKCCIAKAMTGDFTSGKKTAPDSFFWKFDQQHPEGVERCLEKLTGNQLFV